jgi:uncharacterized protein
MSDKVVEFIRNSIKRGHERALIEEKLRGIGIGQQEIAAAFAEAAAPTGTAAAADLTLPAHATPAPPGPANPSAGGRPDIEGALRAAASHAGDFFSDSRRRNHKPFARGASAYFMASECVGAAVLSLMVVAVVVFSPGALPVLVLVPLMFALGAAYGFLYISRFSFALERAYLFVRKGAFIHSYTLLPYENIQDIHVTQGVMERMFGLTRVIIFTATTSAAGAESIPGLGREDAEALKEGLFAKMREAKDVTD